VRPHANGNATGSQSGNGTAPAVWTTDEGLAAGEECLAAALDYLRRGWSVMCCCPPDHVGVGLVVRTHSKKCKSPGKRPWHTWTEYQNRPPTEAEVRRWWKQLPNSNVGAALGPVSGLVRVDVEGEGGGKKLRELCGGDPPRTLAFTSGQPGSLGLLYRIPPGVELQTKREPFKIDEHDELRLQGRGAQTVLPPSRHPKGTRYRWLPGQSPGEVEAAPMLPWMVDMMQVRQRSRKASPDHNPEGTDSADIALALEALEALNKDRASNYDDWLHTGMALHSVSDGDVMLEAWDNWSKNCEEKYEEGRCAEKWATFESKREECIGLGSLVHWAKAAGWKPPRPLRSSTPAPQAQDGLAIILADFHERFDPTFRRGMSIFSRTLGREVKSTEATYAADRVMLEKLARASDAPSYKGIVETTKLPGFFWTYAKSAWQELLKPLKEESATEEIVETARDEFRRLVAVCLLTQATFTERGEPQRRTLLEWGRLWARPGSWKSVRSAMLFCRKTDDGCLQLALRAELFDQYGPHELKKVPHRTFAAKCALYSVGEVGGEQDRPGGRRCVVLTDEFLSDLPICLPEEVAGAHAHAGHNGKTATS
jgi:hypothetical protein